MTAVALPRAGAPSGREVDWQAIAWQDIRHNVYRLQLRIAKAVEESRWGKVRALQRLLACSFSAKALAVKRVVTNQGKKTPGIDGILWKKKEDKEQAIRSLSRRAYRAQPLRRVYIPKANGKKRPLGIPVMRDRAMQALHALGLIPVAETLADPNSYGFREKRSTADALGQCFVALSKRYSPQVVLDADIKACFDQIDQQWMIDHIPMDAKILRSFMQAGYVDAGVFFDTTEGTPQGGVISPVLANMALDGLEAAAKAVVAKRGAKVNVVRYADDFVITGANKRLLEEKVVPAVKSFLAMRGLTLSEEKTRLVGIGEGFDFLGCNVRKYADKLLIKPSPAKTTNFLAEISQTIKSMVAASTNQVIRQLNLKLRGWGNYYRHVVSKQAFSRVDNAVRQYLFWWMRRRHPNKTIDWLRKRYFQRDGTRWTFCAPYITKTGEKRWQRLFKVSDLPIRRHVKIKGEANPYDRAWANYFDDRRIDRNNSRFRDRLYMAMTPVERASVRWAPY